MSLVEVLLLDLDLGYLVQRGPGQKVVLRQPQHLLKVENRIIEVVHLLQRLRFIKVGLAEGYGLKVCALVLSHFNQLVEVFESILVLLELQKEYL